MSIVIHASFYLLYQTTWRRLIATRSLLLLFVFMFVAVVFIARTEGVRQYGRLELLYIKNSVSREYHPDLSHIPDSLSCRSLIHRKTSRLLRKRGRRAGMPLRRRGARPPLPSVFLSNVRSLKNKTDELLSLINTRRDYKECSVYCFTETRLDPDIPSRQ